MVSTKHFDCFSRGSSPLIPTKNGDVTEWLGTGLQTL